MKVKLQPPSGTQLAPFNPILPPASITQIMLLANPTKVGYTQATDNTPLKIDAFAKRSSCVHLHRKKCACATSCLSHLETICAMRLERWTSSPHQKHGVIYSSAQVDGSYSMKECVCVCSRRSQREEVTGTITFSFTFLTVVCHFLAKGISGNEMLTTDTKSFVYTELVLFCR